ncbi:MAG TPA: DUF4129 domain-containing protein [Dehalococcoidales bacterium]|nr:DUF4129 domain-containing protein [Dehalococcoidales bacterium]
MNVPQLVNKIRIPGLPQVIPVLTVMMEVFWIYTWLLWITTLPALGWEAPPLNLISCLALGILVTVAVHLALSSRWSLIRVRWTLIPASLVLLFIVIRLNLDGGFFFFDPAWFQNLDNLASALITASIFGVFIIWRGINAGLQDNSFTSIYRRFLTGLFGIIVVLIIWRMSGSAVSSIWQGVGLEVLLFFGCGLLALAIANLERLRLELKQHQEATASFSRRWVSMLIIMVVAILLMGIILTGLLSHETGAAIVRFLGNLGHWLLTGLLYLLYPVGYLVEVLLWIGRFILSLIRREPPPVFDQEMGGNMPDEWLQAGEGGLPAALVAALKWGSIIIASGLVIYFLSRLLNRYYKVKTEEGVEEVHEALGTWKLFQMDLRGFLNTLLRWLLRRKSTAESGAEQVTTPPAVEESDRIFTIRELYQALLWEGRYNGIPRRASETPNEYNRRLKENRANAAGELDALTEAYVLERYGQTNQPPEKVSWLNEVWRNIRRKFRNKEAES